MGKMREFTVKTDEDQVTRQLLLNATRMLECLKTVRWRLTNGEPLGNADLTEIARDVSFVIMEAEKEDED